MIQTVRKLLLLFTLVLSTAITVPARSEDQAPEPSDPVQAGQTEPALAVDAGATTGGAKDADSGAKGDDNRPAYHPFDWLVFNPLWAVTGWIGDANPIGNHLSAPLESAIPGFRYKGFINSITQVSTTANQTVGKGKRDKDWLLQKQEFRLSNELRYQPRPNLQFVQVSNFQYDGAYNFQDTRGIYDFGGVNQVYYTTFKRIFREGYVQGDYGLLNFTIGKQIVNWGKIDGKVLDFINASDGRDGVISNITDYEWRAIGQWMAVATLKPSETLNVSLLWNPDFQPNVGAAPGSPYWPTTAASPKPGAALAGELVPSGFDNFTQSEIGGRVDGLFGDFSLSGIYYNGYDRNTVTFNTDKLKHHTRHNFFGLSSDYATNILGQRFGLRTEALYTVNQAFGTTDTTVATRVVYKDTVKVGVNFETSVGSSEDKYDLSYTLNWTTVPAWNDKVSTLRHSLVHVPSISHSVHATNDKLVLSSAAYITGGSDYNGMSWQVAGTWRFNDYITAALKYNDYLGNINDSSYGSYYKLKNVTLDVKYEW